jgi:hypothetical protein
MTTERLFSNSSTLRISIALNERVQLSDGAQCYHNLTQPIERYTFQSYDICSQLTTPYQPGQQHSSPHICYIATQKRFRNLRNLTPTDFYQRMFWADILMLISLSVQGPGTV